MDKSSVSDFVFQFGLLGLLSNIGKQYPQLLNALFVTVGIGVIPFAPAFSFLHDKVERRTSKTNKSLAGFISQSTVFVDTSECFAKLSVSLGMPTKGVSCVFLRFRNIVFYIVGRVFSRLRRALFGAVVTCVRSV